MPGIPPTQEQEKTAFEALPIGWYDCAVAEVEPHEGPKGDYLKWILRVESPADYEGRKFFLNTSLTPKALFRLHELKKALALPTDIPLPLASALERRVKVKNRHRVYQGQTQDEVDHVAAPTPPNEVYTGPTGAETEGGGSEPDPF